MAVESHNGARTTRASLLTLALHCLRVLTNAITPAPLTLPRSLRALLQYSVKLATAWRGGNGDVLREFADAANRWGVKICY